MILSKRDRWIVLFLPIAVILFGYFWYGYCPLRKKTRELSHELSAYAMDSESYQRQIQRASQALEQSRKEREKSFTQMAESSSSDPETSCGKVETLPAETRLQSLARQFSLVSLRVISVKRQLTSPPPFHSSFFPDLTRFSLWQFHVQGHYPQVRAFLSSTETNRWGIPMTVTMLPASELGQPADWIIAVLL